MDGSRALAIEDRITHARRMMEQTADRYPGISKIWMEENIRMESMIGGEDGNPGRA